MMFRFRTSVWLWIGFVLLVVAAVAVYVRYKISGTLVLDAPPPRVVADTLEANPEVAASSIEALVTYHLSAAVDSLEAAVPRTYGDIEQRLPLGHDSRANIAYAVSRSPFRVSVSGQTLSLSADVEYQGRAWYRLPIGPELSAGCGTGSDPRPRMRATLVSTAQLTPRWQLHTNTRVLRLEPFGNDSRDRCRLTPLRIDVTDRVIEATRHMLEQKLQKFDQAVLRWPVRPRFVRLWAQLQRRVWLADGVYLEIHPYAAELGPVEASGDTVMARVRMIAAPRVVTGGEPSALRPLPPLQAGSNASSGAHVVVEASLSYPVATGLLRRVLVGKSLVQDGHRLTIQDVQLAGIGGGRVAFSVTLAGRVRGRLYFTGTPSLDSAGHEIIVPDLEYDMGTAQRLVQGFAWLKGVDIRDFLRRSVRLPDTQAAGALRGLGEGDFSRTLAPGVTLSGRIHDARGTSVRATTREIRLRAVANAELKLAIDRGPALPRLAEMARGQAQ